MQGQIFTVGQCLPKSCNDNDVKIMLKFDPAFNQLITEQNTNTLDVLSVRRVPGNYDVFMEKKFYYLW